MKTFMMNLNGVKIAKVQIFSVHDMSQNYDMVGLKFFKKTDEVRRQSQILGMTMKVDKISSSVSSSSLS